MSERKAWGYGLATTLTAGQHSGRVLDAWFPEPALGRQPNTASAPHELASLTGSQENAADRGVRLDVTVCEIDLDIAPADTIDAYLRLPRSAELFFDFNGRRIHRRHHFDDYRLFSVDERQTISEPSTESDVSSAAPSSQ